VETLPLDHATRTYFPNDEIFPNLVTLLPGLHRTSGKWNKRHDFWFDGVTGTVRNSTPIVDWSDYIVPDVISIETPKRK
jgi:hypothetical protein